MVPVASEKPLPHPTAITRAYSGGYQPYNEGSPSKLWYRRRIQVKHKNESQQQCILDRAYLVKDHARLRNICGLVHLSSTYSSIGHHVGGEKDRESLLERPAGPYSWVRSHKDAKIRKVTQDSTRGSELDTNHGSQD